MIKETAPTDWPTLEPFPILVKASSDRMRGHDAQALRNRVGDFPAEFVKKSLSQWLPGEVPLYVTAMGATEVTGPNRNGDGFKRAALQKYHPTFVTKLVEDRSGAFWYRDHANGDTHKSYGIVKDATYEPQTGRVLLIVALNGTKEAADRTGGLVADEELNDIESDRSIPVSMSCVTDPDYPVLTRDRGYVRIADVIVGDFVWTHEGRWRRVKLLNRRKYTGEVHKFSVNGLPLPVELTADHPMYAKVFAGSRELEAVKAKARRYFQNPSEFEKSPAGWTHAAHIGVGDRFFYRPIDRYTGFGSIDSVDLAAIMGYFLAEGSFRYNGETPCTVEFTCNLRDSLSRSVPRILERMYPDITVGISPKSNSAEALSVKVNSTAFAVFLHKYVGSGVFRKTVAPEIFNSPRDVKLAFLGAWLDGDGWCDKKGLHWSTSSVGLALQGRDLLVSLGIPVSIYKIDHSKCPTSGYKHSGPEYTINVSHLDGWNLSPHSEKVAQYVAPTREREKPATMRRCPDGLYAYRIKAVESRHVSDCETYNFEVEEDESYSLGGLISHNCTVSHDVCESCGNKAKTRAHYCTEKTCKHGGCATNLGRVYEDGHVQQVDNPHPNFFDISKISDTQADRVAFSLGLLKEHTKSAAHRPPYVQLAMTLAELENQVDAHRLGWFVESAKTAAASCIDTINDDRNWSALALMSAMLPYRAWCKASGVNADGTSKFLYTRMVAQEKFSKPATWSRSATPIATRWAQQCNAAISLTGRGIFKAAAAGIGSKNTLEIKRGFDAALTASELAYAGYQMRLVQDLPNASSCHLMVATNFLD